MPKFTSQQQPTYLEALAYVSTKAAEYAGYVVIAGSIFIFGVATGWLG